MPILLNARHEAFARALATGKSQADAYADAGYRPSEPHASRLAGNGKVVARVSELLEAADKALVTIESIARQLDEDRQLAFAQGQAGAAVSASLAKARLFGLLVYRTEVQTIQRKPMREPTEVRQMSLEEWEQRFRPRLAEPEHPPAGEEEADTVATHRTIEQALAA